MDRVEVRLGWIRGITFVAMLDEPLRRRLEALNRETLPAVAIARRGATAVPERCIKPSLPARPKSATLSGLLDRGQVIANSAGEHLKVTLSIDEIWPTGNHLLRVRHEQLAQPADPKAAMQVAEDQRGFLDAFPTRFIALDLETCGLSGSALFLVGVARCVDSEIIVELLFARNYAEEAAVLASLGERLAGAEMLVTFNGKSFDWPMVADRWRRYLMHRATPLPELLHYDVLHPARRRWCQTLPDCKLQTIERMICRRSRTGDIAGHLIPGAYDHFVRTGQSAEMEQVLYHNAVDLVTLLDIAMRLVG
jgi:uncharacterized protein YprB with RNaseH-like and TPR domain